MITLVNNRLVNLVLCSFALLSSKSIAAQEAPSIYRTLSGSINNQTSQFPLHLETLENTIPSEVTIHAIQETQVQDPINQSPLNQGPRNQGLKNQVTNSTGIFSGSYKVLCPDRPQGCQCLSVNGEIKEMQFHSTRVTGVSLADEFKNGGESVELKSPDGSNCFLSKKNLLPIYWSSDRCLPDNQNSSFEFPSIQQIVPKGSTITIKSTAAKLYPTFYTIAIEAIHDGPKLEQLIDSESKSVIAAVNKAFRDDLDLEGTGQLNDSRIINVSKYNPKTGWEYKILPDDSFGYGVAGHFLYPFRSAAVDFEWLCQTAKLGDCSGGRQAVTARFAGQLLYLPRLKGIALPNGQTHDGYICAKDVGGAILEDRIDLFVGPTGGGNPYLKECLFKNAYLDAHIESLVPWDWRLFKEVDVNPDGTRKFKRVNPFEYRTFAAAKGLEFQVIPNVKCFTKW